MSISYRAMYRDAFKSCELVKSAAYHISHSDNPILAWFFEWEIFAGETLF